MLRLLILTALTAAAPLQAALAQTSTPVTPVSHTTACENSLVCAKMRDGRSVAITDCKARHDGAVRFLYGDCYDED